MPVPSMRLPPTSKNSPSKMTSVLNALLCTSLDGAAGCRTGGTSSPTAFVTSVMGTGWAARCVTLDPGVESS